MTGKVFAKSGLTVAGDVMHDRPLIITRAMAGYLTAKSGTELVFAMYVNFVPIVSLVTDIFAVAQDQGMLLEFFFYAN